MEVNLPADVFVVASSADIETLRATAAGGSLPPASLVALAPSEPIPQTIIAAAQVLVVEVDPGDKASLRRIAQVRAVRPDLPLIVALRDASISLARTLIRQGVSDVAVLPFVSDELVSQILDASAAVREERDEALDLAPLISVVRSTGGCGSTTVITHLAAALAARDPGDNSVCVIDLDLQSGDVASYFGRRPEVTVADLLEAGDRLDGEFIRNAATDSRHGFDLIAAPAAITPLESVDVDQILKLVTLARRQYRTVLVDLPADWTSWALSVVVASSEVLLVVDTSISSLRQAKRRLELFASVGVASGRTKIVVNRVERRMFKPIGVDEVRDTLGCEVLATLAADAETLRTAQDQGLLIDDIASKSKFGTDIRGLAKHLTAGGD